uniref:RRM domain-containing protein n=1 Tax=Amphora coffeiformis TaxID=265554 RepID=A0A7S3PDH2_9STRA|mmetsp:Transcript_17064/g.34360  ORF Transcript_17064/g.34360 Transcript_17064/m.34360 type:complete len:911 (-) Transcript_17064:74-2806(-)|eukprot:scaffold5108_cov172-Amphora_coffeaeformis.AAC.5
MEESSGGVANHNSDPQPTLQVSEGSMSNDSNTGPTAVTIEWTDPQRSERANISPEQQLHTVNLRAGNFVEEPHERPVSAPPPPGYIDAEHRSRMAEEAIFAPMRSRSKEEASPDDKNYSFDNLAEVLGRGLAESMEDSSRERQNIDAMFNNKNEEDLSLHRHARHAASRLVGVAEPYGGAFKNAPEREDYNTNEGASFAVSRGFPAALSSPTRGIEEEELHEAAKRSTTPVQLFAGQQSSRRPVQVGKDVGLNVDEPQDSDYLLSHMNLQGIVSQRLDGGDHRSTGVGFDMGQVMPSLLNSQSKEFKPSATPKTYDVNDGLSTLSDPLENGSEMSSRQCVMELQPFLWSAGQGKASRTIAIYNATWLRAPEVRSACENYGVLETFRADFASRGIYFASFFDIRSAQYAVNELQNSLQRMALLHGGSDEVIVRYCIPLNSSTQFDESQILISDVPDEVNESNLVAMLSSYGAIQGVRAQGPGSFLVGFHNIQDGKQALLELDSSQPWGPHTHVEVGLRNPVERRKGRELLSIMSRWRQVMGVSSGGGPSGGRQTSRVVPDSTGGGGGAMYNSGYNGMGSSMQTPGLNHQHDIFGSVYGGNTGAGGGNSFGAGRPNETTQLILGPDGRYTQVIVQNPGGFGGYPRYGNQAMDGGQQQVIHGPNGQIFINPVPNMRGNQYFQGGMHGAPNAPSGYPTTVVTNMGYSDGGLLRGGGSGAQPYYSHSVVSDNISVHSGRSHGTHGTHHSHMSTNEDRDNRHLMLDLESVELGKDTRTSLMVRNIPNKYTQQMLLSEFTEHGHGPGVIDFFYLPIDFKNRCNRGYAFINFVDYKDILPFHRRYFGKHWRTFNSDKICDITYARIQGKAAMLKRFENSALMEKDDEYKPLVFGSEGPDRGKRIPFPDPNNQTTKSSF